MSSPLDRRGSRSTPPLPAIPTVRESLRPHDNDAGHPICLEKLAQFLFHDKAPAARRVTHEGTCAIAHDDSSMKHVEILAGGDEKNQIAALQMRLEPWQCRLRYKFHASLAWGESGYDIQNALSTEYRDIRQYRPERPVAYVVANPERHIVIAPLPLNPALFVPNLSQPLGEVIDAGSAGERHNCFDIRDTVESIEGSREHFGCAGGSNQRIWFVRISKEVTGENLNSAAGATVMFRFR